MLVRRNCEKPLWKNEIGRLISPARLVEAATVVDGDGPSFDKARGAL